jgi:DNA-binding transcriptional ArsR family regulator
MLVGVESTFAALAEPARRRLLEHLRSGPLTVGTLAAASGLSQPNTSRHLRILREAELVQARREGQLRVYSLRPQGFEALSAWLTPYAQMWRERLGALEHHLDNEEQDHA